MGKVFIFFAVLAMCAIAAVDSAHAPGPAVDCSTLILNVADCLTFVSNGSKEKKPQSTCCSGLKKVLKIDADCLCEAFKSSAQLGVSLNMTKAISLPSACGVSTSPLSKCGVSLGAPGSAPAQSPTVSPKSPSSTATSEGITAPVPAPIPGATSSACSVSIPFMLLFSVVVVASCSFF